MSERDRLAADITAGSPERGAGQSRRRHVAGVPSGGHLVEAVEIVDVVAEIDDAVAVAQAVM